MKILISLKSINMKHKNVTINDRGITIMEKKLSMFHMWKKKIDHKDKNLRKVKTIVILQKNIKVQLILFIT